MEKEIIYFEKSNLPINFRNLHMGKLGKHRGMHSHRAIEIVEVKSGKLYCYVDEDIIEINPKQIIFINSDIGHKLSSKNAEISYLQIDISLLEENINDNLHSKLYKFISHTQAEPYMVLDNNKKITELINNINVNYNENDKESLWHIKAGLCEIIAFMYSKDFIAPLKISKEQLKKIEQVIEYIDANFKSSITLDDIASSANYNKYTICHTFKELTGSTIFEYINFLRVSYAVEKLRESRNSVSEIATMCGFSSDTYFNRVFKNFFGYSPSVYRRQMTDNILY